MLPIEITFLGTSAARPYGNNGSSALVAKCGGTTILIDCGDGTQIQLDKYKTSLPKINAICITHMHGDHVLGLPGLLSSMELAKRTKALIIIGPPELENFVNSTFKFIGTSLSYQVNYQALDFSKPQENQLTLRDLNVHTIPLNHRVPACGYIIEQKKTNRRLRPDVVKKHEIPYSEIPKIKEGEDYKDKNGLRIANELLTLEPKPTTPIAYLTDTEVLAQYPNAWQSPDILIHDATFAESEKSLAKPTGHSTLAQAATFAHNCEAKKLFLTHNSARYENKESILGEAKAIFPKAIFAEPGMTLTS